MNASSEEWISVSQHELNEVESKEQRGIKLQFMLSPADLPTAWRGYHLNDTTVAVEFKYLSSNESKTIEQQGDGVSIEVGKNSKRIYRIILDIIKIPSSGAIMVSRATVALEQSHGLNKHNSEVIQKFLTSKKSRPELLHMMEA
ncbi:hypothetical protein NHG95_04480 [Pseudomonas corrugata]|uniref:hypothetical protein n=1 Tax=Pseudomonas corrugata TaxID=47879 RepID=UPI0028C3F180|nr:hypothetical protein [Pseudomonas corrugata]MDU9032399.1 hypothetical protein [Pseudomonas corrugata]